MAKEEIDKMRRMEKKRREKEEEEVDPELRDSSSMDPLLVLGSDLVTKILKLLDARSVARLLVLSRPWHHVASADRIWAPKREELWKGKAHIPRLSMVRGASKLATYSLCIMDGKRANLFPFVAYLFYFTITGLIIRLVTLQISIILIIRFVTYLFYKPVWVHEE